MLIVDAPLSDLLQTTQERASATEADVLDVLRRYSVSDALLAFGFLSREIFFNSHLPGRINAALLKDPESGVLVSQFSLSYLSSMVILSGSNDYKMPITKPGKMNIAGMSQIYNNCLKAAFSKEEVEKYGAATFLMRMYAEQFSYQISGGDMLARTFIMFQEIAPSINRSNLDQLDVIHIQETGLSIMDFLWVSFAVFALLQNRATFRVSQLTDAEIPRLREYLTLEKIEKFIKLVSSNYSEFRDLDFQMSSLIKSPYTKTRFNVLIQYPIVRLQNPNSANPFVIPNVIAYIRRVTDGIYWWFDNHFKENASLSRDVFRSYFGDVFQEYVGRVLKAIYGSANVMPEFPYGAKTKREAFSDWWVIRKNKLYLFEVKASQVNLHNRSVCDVAKYKSEEIPKVTKAIKQLFLKVKHIESGNFHELESFRGKQVVPVAVFYDMPFIAERGLYGGWIKEELQRMEQADANLAGVSDFKYYLINVDELDSFESISKRIELEDVFHKNDELAPNSNILSTMSQMAGDIKLESRYLKSAYDRFFRTAI